MMKAVDGRGDRKGIERDAIDCVKKNKKQKKPLLNVLFERLLG